jgi:hypothetical protein
MWFVPTRSTAFFSVSLNAQMTGNNQYHAMMRTLSPTSYYISTPMCFLYHLPSRVLHIDQKVQHAGGRPYDTLPHKRYGIEQDEWFYLMVKDYILHQVDGAVVSRSSCNFFASPWALNPRSLLPFYAPSLSKHSTHIERLLYLRNPHRRRHQPLRRTGQHAPLCVCLELKIPKPPHPHSLHRTLSYTHSLSLSVATTRSSTHSR